MRPRPALAAAVTLVTVLSACSSDGSSSPDPTAAATDDATATPTEVPSESPTTASPTPTEDPTPPPPDPDIAATSADELASRLVAAELAIRDPATDDALRGWARVQHASYRALHDHPDWVEEVAAAMPAEIRPAFDANLHAQESLFALTTPREELPDWRIVPAPPAEELLGYYRAAADEFGIDWTYLAAIHLVESRMGRIRGDSTAGAQGPMQFMPATWDAYGEGDVQDPHDAIRAAARYLVAHGAPGDMPGALWAYNHSDRYVAAIEAYAAVMRAEPVTYEAYYHWRVYYRLVSGDVVLEEGWTNPESSS